MDASSTFCQSCEGQVRVRAWQREPGDRKWLRVLESGLTRGLIFRHVGHSLWFFLNFYLQNLGGLTESRLAATAGVLGRTCIFSPRRSRCSAADETVGGETNGAVHAERQPRLVSHAAPVDHSLIILLLPLPIIHSPFYGSVGFWGLGGSMEMVGGLGGSQLA